MSSHQPPKITTKTLLAMKQNKEKISALTAFDFIIAKLLDEAGVEIILVGDSLSNVFQGNESTLPVTLEEMIYHTKIVRRAVKRALVVADMPFLSYQVSVEDAVRNCGRMMKETGAEAVKIEGGKNVAPIVQRLTSIGIPVMGHLGLTPQSVHQFGGYQLRAKEKEEADMLFRDAKVLDESGCFSIVLEKIPSSLAAKVSRAITIPTIGIGAGMACDGQVLVTYDMLGMFEDFTPKFVRQYLHLATDIRVCFSAFKEDVKKKSFPSKEESF
ncbi:MAG: 3-methyl-2-oxobutanoate hydroxymethyltransferase [Bacteroidota bacterium]|mgnify:CR=1 FL=1